VIRRLIAAAITAFERSGNPWAGHDVDLERVWNAVDTTTTSPSFFRNYHETKVCVYRRLNHAAAEGTEYRGVEP